MDNSSPGHGQDSEACISTEDFKPCRTLVSTEGASGEACVESCSPADSALPGSAAPSTVPQETSDAKPCVNRRFQRKDGLGLTRDTRYTVEGVLDQRTIRHIQHVVRAASVRRIFGTISCGKESNVYFALGENVAGEANENGGLIDEGDDALGGRPSNASSWLRPFAMKVFRTSILAFKDRSRYVQGDFRFNNAYSRNHNPRKMVEVWTLKEFRNLRRLNDAGIPSPRPIAFKSNVLLLEFIGDAMYLPEGQVPNGEPASMWDFGCSVLDCVEGNQDGEGGVAVNRVCTSSAVEFENSCCKDSAQSAVWVTGSFSRHFSESQLVYDAAPRLKDLIKYFSQSHRTCGRWCTRLPRSLEDIAASWRYMYVQVVYLLRAMFVRCQMIHGDLSEFNLLLSKRRVVVIDVSQAIQRDHPRALDFLKRDCKNVTSFFAKNIQIAEQRLSNQSNEEKGKDECRCMTNSSQYGTGSAFPIVDLPEVFHTRFRALTVRELFEFVVSASLPQQLYNELKLRGLVQGTEPSKSAFESVLACFARFLFCREGEGENWNASQYEGDNDGESVADAVFFNSWVPTSLHGVGGLNAVQRLVDGVPEEAEEFRLKILKKMTEKFDEWDLDSSCSSSRDESRRSSCSSAANVNYVESSCGSTSSHASERSCDDSDSGGECEKFTGKIPVGVDRKEWKKMVKEQNRERRLHKIPKKVKKRFKKNATKR